MSARVLACEQRFVAELSEIGKIETAGRRPADGNLRGAARRSIRYPQIAEEPTIEKNLGSENDRTANSINDCGTAGDGEFGRSRRGPVRYPESPTIVCIRAYK